MTAMTEKMTIFFKTIGSMNQEDRGIDYRPVLVRVASALEETT